MYKITIEEITKEMVRSSEYVGKDEPGANDSGYRQREDEKEVMRLVYEQRVPELTLVDVINAVNKIDKKPNGN